MIRCHTSGTHQKECDVGTQRGMIELVQKKAVLDAVDVLYNVTFFKVSTAALGISRNVLLPLRW